MSADYSFEKMCSAILVMSKPEVIWKLLNFDGQIKLDFSQSYLEGMNVERLRHILLAAVITSERKRAS